MSQFDYQQFYEGHLPHIQPPDATLFVTFRLADSIPKHVLRLWKAEKDWLEEETERIGRLKKAEASLEINALGS